MLSQKVIILKGELVKDAYINSTYNEPDGHRQSLISAQWTYFGDEGLGRSLIKFDLSEIPEFAIIESASLSLYHDPSSFHIGHSDLGGDNTGLLLRAAESWDDEEVYWYSQPHATNTHRILIHPPENESQDYENIDVTKLVQDMINNTDVQHGFMIKLLREDALYRSLVFASNDHSDESIRPLLEVVYTENESEMYAIHIKPNAAEGKDAYINSVNSGNDGNGTSLNAARWTYFGETGTGRFLIDFPFPSIPGDKEIVRAELNLYHNPASGHLGHSTMGGSNELVIRRIIQDWDEQTVVWNNQPATTDQNEVIVLSSNIGNEHYLNIDVTEMMKDMIRNPSEGFGFQVRLQDETDLFRSAVFASSDYPAADLRPSLTVYTNYLIANEYENAEVYFSVNPNPNNGNFHVDFSESLNCRIQIYDVTGRLFYDKDNGGQFIEIQIPELQNGIYFVRVSYGNKTGVKKIVVE